MVPMQSCSEGIFSSQIVLYVALLGEISLHYVQIRLKGLLNLALRRLTALAAHRSKHAPTSMLCLLLLASLLIGESFRAISGRELSSSNTVSRGAPPTLLTIS